MFMQELAVGERVEISRLDNGVDVLSLALPHTQSTALGFWVENGSRYQQPGEDGFAHLLEHMLFKGTVKHAAAELNAAMEPLGGNVNAYTDRELTVYHATVLGEDLDDAFALMQEMVAHSTLPLGELRLEKSVVAQEAAMVAEDSEDWVQEYLSRRLWGDDPLGWPILGRASAIRRISRARLKAYYARHYVGRRLKVVAAGAVDHDRLLNLARRYLGQLPAGAPRPRLETPVPQSGREVLHRQSMQAHLAWGAPGLAVDSPEYYQANVANLLLGGSSGSRLFSELRERLGLAYNVYSQLECYRDTGEWRIYVASEDWRRCERTLSEVLDAFRQHGPRPEELARSKRHLRAQLLMSLEDVETRMSRLARQWLYLGRTVPAAESLDCLDAVTGQDVRTCMQNYWRDSFQLLCLPKPAR